MAEHEIQVAASVSVAAAGGLLARPLCTSAGVQQALESVGNLWSLS